LDGWVTGWSETQSADPGISRLRLAMFVRNVLRMIVNTQARRFVPGWNRLMFAIALTRVS